MRVPGTGAVPEPNRTFALCSSARISLERHSCKGIERSMLASKKNLMTGYTLWHSTPTLSKSGKRAKNWPEHPHPAQVQAKSTASNQHVDSG